MIVTSSKAKSAVSARRLVTTLRQIERSVDGDLGTDEVAARVRRYIADHDAPADDRSAFERLCTVIFAQGIGFSAVAGKAEAHREAFAGFDPAAVARFDDAAQRRLLQAPIIRNRAKIAACVENARRWCELAAEDGTYLARIARIAAGDDPAQGWPILLRSVTADHVRLGESTARQVLKRWGFFTAHAHPGARRALERLGFVATDESAPSVQRMLGRAAEKLGRDPYAVEALLALFAGAGPCAKTPACGRCVLSERCPSAAV